MTRMFFAVAFARADGAPDSWSHILDPLSHAPVTLGGGSPPKDPVVQTAAAASRGISLNQSFSTRDAVALATGASIAGDPRRALMASTMAVQQSPDDPRAQYSYAVALHQIGARRDQIIASMESAASKSNSASGQTLLASIYASLTYLYLYDDRPPGGFERAIAAAAAYDAKGGQPNAGLEINRACAFGQKVKFMRSKEAPAEEIQAARDLALAAVKKALEIDGSVAARLKQLLWVTGDAEDDDLAIFQGDSEFSDLLPDD